MTETARTLLLAAALVACAACGERGGDALVARELAGTDVAVIGDRVWILGGNSGPDGSSPPDSSDLPPGWGANSSVISYRLDGSVEDRYELPLAPGKSIFSARVVRSGEQHYVIGAECIGWALGCRESTQLAAFRLGDPVERVELPLPAVSELPDAGWIRAHLGQHGRWTWLEQDLGQHEDLTGERARLVAVDLEQREAVLVPLPAGAHAGGSICASRGSAFHVQLGADGGVDVRQRDLQTVEGEWQPLAEIRDLSDPVHAARVFCLDHVNEVLVSMDAPTGQRIVSIATTTGAVLNVTPSDILASLQHSLPGTDLSLWHDRTLNEDKLRRYAGSGVWSPVDTGPVRRGDLDGWVTVEGAIYDVGAWRGHAYAERGPAARRLLELDEVATAGPADGSGVSTAQ